MAIDYKAYPVMVVDDEPDIVRSFTFNYRKDFTILGSTSPNEALGTVQSSTVSVVVADQRMPEMTGVEFLKRVLALRPAIVPIILTGYTDVEALVRAINLGSLYRYIPKPWDRDELREAIRLAIERYHLAAENARLLAENARLVERLRSENAYLREQSAGQGRGFERIIGRSPALTRVLDLARRALDTDTTILIEGPTGTGKELLARAIHEAGPRAERLFVPVNTGGLTEGLVESTLFGHVRGAFTGAVGDRKGVFELADGGTLFLDEVGEMSPAVQVHLLRVLQDREVMPVGGGRPVHVDVRVIAASNRDLEAEVRAGRFREDLLHRLRVFPLRLPPLAERREDIAPLAEHLLAELSSRVRKPIGGFEPEALAALSAYRFPGNVRELGNLIERAILLSEPGDRIGATELFDQDIHSGPSGNGASLAADLFGFEGRRLVEMLDACGGNKSAAARRLGLTYRGLVRKLHRHGLMDDNAPE